jgi:hypothetical protein
LNSIPARALAQSAAVQPVFARLDEYIARHMRPRESQWFNQGFDVRLRRHESRFARCAGDDV